MPRDVFETTDHSEIRVGSGATRGVADLRPAEEADGCRNRRAGCTIAESTDDLRDEIARLLSRLEALQGEYDAVLVRTRTAIAQSERLLDPIAPLLRRADRRGRI